MVLALPYSIAHASVYGKNKVHYRKFDWNYLTTEHFDIYYSQGSRDIADFAAIVAETSFQDIAKSIRYRTDVAEPIRIIIYDSHNDFKQTNLTSQEPSEGTGGFTEFLMSRVVVPFEGDHEKFRHVIHHELTHAMMINMLFGQGLEAIVSGISQSRIPLWFIEGLAEYQSRNGLDYETEMFLRDAVFNDLLPEFHQLDYMGFLGVYKLGQSVLYWITWRYGEDKLGELMVNLRVLRDFDRAIRATFGFDQVEMSKRWRQFIKEKYWPVVASLEPPDRRAMRLTDHEKDLCFVNNSPALSPSGEYIAFLSDRSDYFDIYLMRTIDNKVIKRLVRGQRTGELEDLHWLKPGITWSPDGKHIAICAKAGDRDALHIINVDKAKITKTFKYESDALFSPSWSPDGEHIACIMQNGGKSDLIVVNIKSGKYENITDDVYDDADPSWSIDSKNILFTSNRDGNSLSNDTLKNKDMLSIKLEQFDIYEVNLETRELFRLTDEPHIKRTPIWSGIDNTIIYVSNRSGTYNLYAHNVVSGDVKPLLNNVTGSFQPSIAYESKTLVFSSFFSNGYDLFMLNNPFRDNYTVDVVQLQPAESIPKSDADFDLLSTSGDYSSFVFDRLWADRMEGSEEAEDDTLSIAVREPDAEGSYASKKYKASLHPNIVSGAMSYNNYFGINGTALLMLSDILGDHQIFMEFELNRSTENSNFLVNYHYLPQRLNWNVGMYHFAYPFYTRRTLRDEFGNQYRSYVVWRDRNFGLFTMTSYPLDRFNRFEYGIDFSFLSREALWAEADQLPSGAKRNTAIMRLGYVHDTSVWHTWTEPANGQRWRVDGYVSPGIFGKEENQVEFQTVTFDWRRYLNYKKYYSFSFRMSGGLSEGNNPQRFFMGGMSNWINPRYDNLDRRIQVENVEDIYFSKFVTPLRGVGYYSRQGTRYLLSNNEFRFPAIKHLVFGWPLPLYLRNIRGSLFMDYGAAWFDNELGGRLLPKSWTYGYGVGLRVDLGIFPLEWNLAWSPDPRSQLRPMHYFSINIGY